MLGFPDVRHVAQAGPGAYIGICGQKYVAGHYRHSDMPQGHYMDSPDMRRITKEEAKRLRMEGWEFCRICRPYLYVNIKLEDVEI